MLVAHNDINKIKELVLYVASKNADNPRFGSTVLNKMLYYSDFFWYAYRGESISGDTYVRNRFGPTPKHLMPAIDKLKSESAVAQAETTYYNFEQSRIVPLRESKSELFTKEQLELVDAVIGWLRSYSAQEVSEMTHRELSWNLLKNGEIVPYYTVFLRSVNPITEDTMAWAESVLTERRAAA